jgi:hypothetical protein
LAEVLARFRVGDHVEIVLPAKLIYGGMGNAAKQVARSTVKKPW